MNIHSRPDYLLISILVAFAFPVLYISFLGNDNTATIYQDMTNSPSYWLGQYENYRYVSAAAGWLLHSNAIGYYSLIYLWCALFSAGIVLSCYEFQRFCDLPNNTLPFIILAVTLNGYMSDLYAFSMVFFAYGIAYLGVAIALRMLRQRQNIFGFIIASLATTVSFGSYQVTTIILLFAASIKLMQASISGFNKSNYKAYFLPILTFLSGMLLYLAIKHFIGPDGGRDVSFKYILSNLTQYLNFIPTMLMDGIRGANPGFELLTYFISLLIVVILLVFAFMRDRNLLSIIAIVAFTCSLLIIACPFTLMPEGFWPAPRQMTASVYFFVGVTVICYSASSQRLQNALKYTAIIFITASTVSQVLHFAFMKGQDERDELAVQLIVDEISRYGDITPETKIAVISSSKSQVNSQHRLSAFNEPWSNATIFRVLTGNFTAAPMPNETCKDPIEGAWIIKKIDDTIVICME